MLSTAETELAMSVAVRQDDRNCEEHSVVRYEDGLGKHLGQEDEEVRDAVRRLQQDDQRLPIR